MDVIERLVRYAKAFNELPFLARRTIVVAFSIALWIVGAMLASFHAQTQVCMVFLVAGGVGALWASELWRIWKPVFYLIVTCIVIMK